MPPDTIADRNKQKHETDKCENDIIDQSCYVCPADHNNDIVKIQSDAQSQTEVKATKANGGPPTTNPESKNCNIHMNSNNNEGDKDLPNVRLRRETNDSLFPFGFVILTVCGVPFARKVVCK
jgi:hypothetical protein